MNLYYVQWKTQRLFFSYLFHYCDNMPNKSNLRMKELSLVPSLRAQSILTSESQL